jgi:hypothetical protein
MGYELALNRKKHQAFVYSTEHFGSINDEIS